MVWRYYWRSLVDVAAYPQLDRLRPRVKLGLLLVVYFILAAVSTTHFALVTRPRLIANWQGIWDEIKQSWPEDLVVRYQDQRLSITPEQPFTVPYPPFLADRAGLPTHLARLDTANQPANPHDSLFFVTGDTVTVRNITGDEQATAVSTWLADQSWQLNRANLADHDTVINTFFAEVTQTLTATWFGWRWLGLLLLRLLGLILYAWIAQALLGIFGVRLSYRRSYGLGLIVLLPAETVQTLISFYPQPLPVFWWAWLVMTLLIGWLNRGRWSAG